MRKKTRHSLIRTPHTHPPDPGEHRRAHGLWGHLASALHLPGHTHAHAVPGHRDPMLTNRMGTLALRWSLTLLFATTIVQFTIYMASGSVALLADTIHNLGDALNSVPLLIAFWLARHPATKRYTYGYARAEDLGGLLVVASIVFSAGYILWEVLQKFTNPLPIQNSGWVILAAIIGFLGNEAVAVLEIRVGSQIGSEALVVDGRHARIDGLTSLAVLPAVIGSAIGLPILDPIFGILIGIAILFITRDATISIWRRLMDAVDPAIYDRVYSLIRHVPKVNGIHSLRLRWVGHSLWVEGRLDLDQEMTTSKIEDLLNETAHVLRDQVPNLEEVNLSLGKAV